jgi:hypothetical protein
LVAVSSNNKIDTNFMRWIFLGEVFVGIILIPLSFVVKNKYPKVKWVALLSAGITAVAMGITAFIVFSK